MSSRGALGNDLCNAHEKLRQDADFILFAFRFRKCYREGFDQFVALGLDLAVGDVEEIAHVTANDLAERPVTIRLRTGPRRVLTGER